jgi:hypothetical protein
VTGDEVDLVRDYFPDDRYDTSYDSQAAESSEPVAADSGDDLGWLEGWEGASEAPAAPESGPQSFAELESWFTGLSESDRQAWLASLSPNDRSELLALHQQERVDADVKMLLDSVDRQGSERVAETRQDTAALEQAEREVAAFLAERAGRGADVQMLRRVADEVFEKWIHQGYEPSAQLAVQALEAAAAGGRNAEVGAMALRRA